MAAIEELASTLQMLARPGIKRKELLAAVREKHPKASKKDIVRAAFYSLTSAVEGDAERVQRLHDFALSERHPKEAAPIPAKRRKKDRRGDGQRNQQQAG